MEPRSDLPTSPVNKRLINGEARQLIDRSGRVKKRMLLLLSDGLEHTRKELHACLDDELGGEENIYPHITNIRHELRKIGLTIRVIPRDRVYMYRLVRLPPVRRE